MALVWSISVALSSPEEQWLLDVVVVVVVVVVVCPRGIPSMSHVIVDTKC